MNGQADCAPRIVQESTEIVKAPIGESGLLGFLCCRATRGGLPPINLVRTSALVLGCHLTPRVASRPMRSPQNPVLEFNGLEPVASQVRATVVSTVALMLFANTYGGTILISVDETSTGAAVLPVHGLDLRPGLREHVLQIALDNIYPPLVPDVHVIPIKSSATIAAADRAVIVVRVHESDDAPHAVEERTYP
jgi:Putative DNA-binding domain